MHVQHIYDPAVPRRPDATRTTAYGPLHFITETFGVKRSLNSHRGGGDMSKERQEFADFFRAVYEFLDDSERGALIELGTIWANRKIEGGGKLEASSALIRQTQTHQSWQDR